MDQLKHALFAEVGNSELKCDVCNRCLSVPPIYHNNVLGNVCGRSKCFNMAKSIGKNSEQFVYQNIAKFLLFPCMYRDNGCLAELKWSDAQKHELTCNFEECCCPFSEMPKDICIWKGEQCNLLSHMEDKHINRKFFNNLEVILKTVYTFDSREIYFSRIEEDIVIVIFCIDKEMNMLHCKLWADINVYKNLKYQIKLCDENNTSSTALKKKNAELLSSEILKCQLGKDWLCIDFNNLENFIDNPELMILYLDYYGSGEISSKDKTLSHTLFDYVFSVDLRQAKCDSCYAELIPPVYMCGFAHNICHVCRTNETCPKCSSSMRKSRNIAFEKLKLLVCQPCKNSSKGCEFKAPYPKIEYHEEECVFQSRKCVLGCSHQIDNLLQHLRINHPFSISDLDVLLGLNRLNSNVFLYDNQIFLFTKKLVIDEGLLYNIQCLGMKEVRYQYELLLVNDKFHNTEIKLSNICHPELTNLEKHGTSYTRGLTNSILIPYPLFEQFFSDLRTLKFKMNIFKIQALGAEIK